MAIDVAKGPSRADLAYFSRLVEGGALVASAAGLALMFHASVLPGFEAAAAAPGADPAVLAANLSVVEKAFSATVAGTCLLAVMHVAAASRRRRRAR